MNIIKTLAAAALATAAVTSGASAATIATAGKSVDITCTGSCDFWDLGDGSEGFSATGGDWLSAAYGGLEGNGNGNGNAGNSAANRLAFVEQRAGHRIRFAIGHVRWRSRRGGRARQFHGR